MKTHNEKVQAHLAEGITNARFVGVPREMEDSYCAAYLAQKLAHVEYERALAYSPRERENLADWASAHEDYGRDVFSDLDWKKVVKLIRTGEFDLGSYLISKLTISMIDDLESQDAEPDHIAEDDMRQRVRDANKEAEWLGAW
jgi:hypothetical protein